MFSLLGKVRTLALPLTAAAIPHAREHRLHLQISKYVLSLNTYTYTNMVYGETGEIPFSLCVKSRIVNYWSRLITCMTKKLSCLFVSLYIVYTQIIGLSTTFRGYYLLRKYYVIMFFQGSGKAKLFPLK